MILFSVDFYRNTCIMEWRLDPSKTTNFAFCTNRNNPKKKRFFFFNLRKCYATQIIQEYSKSFSSILSEGVWKLVASCSLCITQSRSWTDVLFSVKTKVNLLIQTNLGQGAHRSDFRLQTQTSNSCKPNDGILLFSGISCYNKRIHRGKKLD